MRFAFIVISTLLSQPALSQNTLKTQLKDKKTGGPLPGAAALVVNTSLGASADESGWIIIDDIPDGKQVIQFSFVGYETQIRSYTFPLDSEAPMVVLLEESEEELEEIIVTSTRSSRTIADIPTRVELIAGEELEEKGNMKPGDIRMLLNESTGIQTQQTSATSANASIRIQGLDGRYTQILKDGFPLYAGYSGGLGLLQTPPLDLKQVEVIKGSSSTLYGGGAIAGLVNLISKRPGDEREFRLWFNGTSAKGLDLNGFYAKDFGRIGVTVFGSRNSNDPYDPAGIDLTAIPKFERYVINPKIFIDVSDKGKLDLGLNFTTEDRIGGDVLYIQGKGDTTHSYFEKNDTDRISSQLSYTHSLSERNELALKNSISHFKRFINTPGYTFDGTQNSTFTEISYTSLTASTEWITGVNIWTDKFSEIQTTSTPLRDYSQVTVGAFIQNNLALSSRFSLESGLRADYVVEYGFTVLPRVSLLYKPSLKFSSRVGGGLGYKTPTIFTEESERIQYQNVLPISTIANAMERSYGANWDLNYKSTIADGAIGININQLFFYTFLQDPLFLQPLPSGNFEFVNINGYTDSKGLETNIRLDYGDFKLFIGYTLTDTKINSGGTASRNSLTSRHRLNNVLMYEVHESWKVGLEAYYYSPQKLNDGTTGRAYWINGLMIEKIWERFSLYINFENFLDTRQTRFDTIYTGTITNPVFRDIYAPVDGFVVNGGIKLSL